MFRLWGKICFPHDEADLFPLLIVTLRYDTETIALVDVLKKHEVLYALMYQGWYC